MENLLKIIEINAVAVASQVESTKTLLDIMYKNNVFDCKCLKSPESGCYCSCHKKRKRQIECNSDDGRTLAEEYNKEALLHGE